MNCPTCHQSVKPRFTTEDQSKNGVRVIVRRSAEGSTVDADCDCFGSDLRAHSRVDCPNRQERLRAALADFCERANEGRPPMVDERAIAYARSIVCEMIAEGTLDDHHRVKMLESVRLAPDGKVTGCVVSRIGGGVVDMEQAA